GGLVVLLPLSALALALAFPSGPVVPPVFSGPSPGPSAPSFRPFLRPAAVGWSVVAVVLLAVVVLLPPCS
ncbi:ABC transporter permease, partial [Mycobacterium tuberculosis]